MTATMLDDARAEALFCSDLSIDNIPTFAVTDDAIRQKIRALGSRGCAADLAEAYGRCPEFAARRMGWARNIVAGHYHGGER